MWNLKRLHDLDARSHLDVAFQNGEVTDIEKTFLMELYQQYELELGRPSLAMLAAGQRPALYSLVHDAYELVQDKRRLKKLRADLKLLADYCPYCGFAPISDLDHYLQRGRFKLLSIFALNLVPCCSPCNSTKSRTPSSDPTKHQLHPYLELVNQFDFLRADVAIHAATNALEVNYRIEQCAGMSAELHNRLQHHLVEFDLRNKYAKQVNIHLSSHEQGMIMTFNTGPAQLLEYLTGTANRNAKNFGPNDWRTALFFGLSRCNEFWNGGFQKALGILDDKPQAHLETA
jgi:hypothetical protein